MDCLQADLPACDRAHCPDSPRVPLTDNSDDAVTLSQVACERSDVSYQIVAVDFLSPAIQRQKLIWLTQELAAGRLRPLPRIAHGMSEAIAALRQMSQARHIGKVVVTRGAEDPAPSRRGVGRTVIVTGGMGMLGTTVAGWLIENGVRHFKLLGRKGKTTGTAAVTV